MNPAVGVLSDGAVVVTWSSYGQDGSMQGIFGQRLSANGARIGGEFQVNQFSPFNQRTPTIVGLSNGRFVVTWVSEQKRFENSIDVYGRVFGGGVEPNGNEFLVNTATNICANPALTALPDGGFMVGWSERDIANRNNAWDVYVRRFGTSGQASGAAAKLNTHSRGNHYAPQIASLAETSD